VPSSKDRPAYRERDNYSGDEQLWQPDVGNTLPLLAMAWVLSGDQQHLDAARQWSLASCGYQTWGLGRIDGLDLAAGHQLFGLALVYDWCYADLGDEARRTIRNTLVKRTSAMPTTPPSSLPTFRCFEDMGIVPASSDWSGDESLLVFKCGPFLGH
jgi:hypothetical protein